MSENRTPDITDDIVDNPDGEVFNGRGIHIETGIVLSIEPIYQRLERREGDFLGEKLEDRKLPTVPEPFIIDMVKFFPKIGISDGFFTKDHMDMRIPFEIASESVKDADHTGDIVFGFVSFIKNKRDSISRSLKQEIEQRTVKGKIFTQILGNGKDNVSMRTIKKFSGDIQSPVFGVFGATAVAKPAFAGKRNMLDGVAIGTGIQSKALFRVLAVDDFFHFVHNHRPNVFVLGTHFNDKVIPMICKNLFNCIFSSDLVVYIHMIFHAIDCTSFCKIIEKNSGQILFFSRCFLLLVFKAP